MSALEHLIATPRLVELDEVDLALSPAETYRLVRHGDLARSRLVHALFSLRTLPSRLRHPGEPLRLSLDDLTSTPARPGFQVLWDDPPREVAVAAIGRVWEPDIPFVHVVDAEAFAAFDEPDYVKVAWSLRITPIGDFGARLALEVRVDATSDEAFRKFRSYFRLIGPASRFIRRSLLADMARSHGTPESKENERPLPGDAWLPDAAGQLSHAVTIAAPPEAIWPWLVQMGGRRAGFYGVDWLDNGGRRSAREVHPELQTLAVGDVLPASPEGRDGFEVLALDAPSELVLGALYDVACNEQLPFRTPRPPSFWQVTWSFALEALDATHTRLHVRARAACSDDERGHLRFIAPVHQLMERAQLRHLAARIEGRARPDDARDVVEGLSGALVMALDFATPFLRDARSHWGLSEAEAARSYPGDELVPTPTWGWTHAIEIDARPGDVWPWLAQIGAGRAGFYSYQWLENLAGCRVRNAESVHPAWEIRPGDALLLHPDMPGLTAVDVERGSHFVVYGAPDETARAAGAPCAAVSWLFLIEPRGPGRCRVISRYRLACSDDVKTRLAYGPLLLEPVGFAMDRRMLRGLKERAERVEALSTRAQSRDLTAP